MQEASVRTYQGECSRASPRDVFSFCVKRLGRDATYRAAPHGIGRTAAQRTGIVIVAIAIVVDIGENAGGRSGSYRKRPFFSYGSPPSFLAFRLVIVAAILLLAFRHPFSNLISNSTCSTYGANAEAFTGMMSMQ